MLGVAAILFWLAEHLEPNLTLTLTLSLTLTQAAKWTSKGFPFSTRERFPRVRSKWKD